MEQRLEKYLRKVHLLFIYEITIISILTLECYWLFGQILNNFIRLRRSCSSQSNWWRGWANPDNHLNNKNLTRKRPRKTRKRGILNTKKMTRNQKKTSPPKPARKKEKREGGNSSEEIEDCKTSKIINKHPLMVILILSFYQFLPLLISLNSRSLSVLLMIIDDFISLTPKQVHEINQLHIKLGKERSPQIWSKMISNQKITNENNKWETWSSIKLWFEDLIVIFVEVSIIWSLIWFFFVSLFKFTHLIMI